MSRNTTTPNPSYAYSLVAKAIHEGELPKLDGSIPCADCGQPATNYEHRDYSKPLEVEPVCSKCNHSRGHAVGVRGPKLLHNNESYMLRIRMSEGYRALLEEAAKLKSLQLSSWARSERASLLLLPGPIIEKHGKRQNK
jgi:hypothetical protein